MFTITNKVRTLIALGAVAATVGSTAVASASTVGYRPVTTTPIVVNQPMAIHLPPTVKAAGSAGISGYDDARCQSLAHDYNTATKSAADAAKAGDLTEAGDSYGIALNIYEQMSDNCMVID